MLQSTLLVDLIILSQMPPICGDAGGLKFQVIPSFVANSSTAFVEILSSFTIPLKLVPQSLATYGWHSSTVGESSKGVYKTVSV